MGLDDDVVRPGLTDLLVLDDEPPSGGESRGHDYAAR